MDTSDVLGQRGVLKRKVAVSQTQLWRVLHAHTHTQTHTHTKFEKF